jgi:hypothetical protein
MDQLHLASTAAEAEVMGRAWSISLREFKIKPAMFIF